MQNFRCRLRQQLLKGPFAVVQVFFLSLNYELLQVF